MLFLSRFASGTSTCELDGILLFVFCDKTCGSKTGLEIFDAFGIENELGSFILAFVWRESELDYAQAFEGSVGGIWGFYCGNHAAIGSDVEIFGRNVLTGCLYA